MIKCDTIEKDNLMEIKYLEVNGVLLPLSQEATSDDNNQDAVARVSEMMELLENAESNCVSLSTSGAF
jgi:hypothetical protein